MTVSANSLKRLELLQQHRRENNQFCADKRLERETLTRQHGQDLNELPMSESNFMIWVAFIRCHRSENMEFNAVFDEKQWRLCNQHKQELLYLDEYQSKGETTA